MIFRQEKNSLNLGKKSRHQFTKHRAIHYWIIVTRVTTCLDAIVCVCSRWDCHTLIILAFEIHETRYKFLIKAVVLAGCNYNFFFHHHKNYLLSLELFVLCWTLEDIVFLPQNIFSTTESSNVHTKENKNLLISTLNFIL